MKIILQGIETCLRYVITSELIPLTTRKADMIWCVWRAEAAGIAVHHSAFSDTTTRGTNLIKTSVQLCVWRCKEFRCVFAWFQLDSVLCTLTPQRLAQQFLALVRWTWMAGMRTWQQKHRERQKTRKQRNESERERDDMKCKERNRNGES